MFASIFGFIHKFFASLKPWVVVNPWEQCLRVRLGKNIRLLGAGIHYRLPFFDEFFVQPIRLRIIGIERQTLTCLDGRSVTLDGTVGFSITDLEALYRSLHQVDHTIRNIVKAAVSDSVCRQNAQDLQPGSLANTVHNVVRSKLSYAGLLIESYSVTMFVVSDNRGVRTIRLVGDWGTDRDNTYMDLDKPAVSALGTTPRPH